MQSLRNAWFAVLFLFCLLGTGCATLTGNQHQPVDTRPIHQMSGGFAISTDPADAHVWVGSDYCGQTTNGMPVYAARLTVYGYPGDTCSSSGRIVVKKRGYKDYSETYSYTMYYPDPVFFTDERDLDRPVQDKPGYYYNKPNLRAPWQTVMIVLQPAE